MEIAGDISPRTKEKVTMAEKGKMDKGKKEPQKKAQHTLMEKRKLKKEKKKEK